MEKGHNEVNTLRILTARNAITVDFWDGDKKKWGKMTQEGVLNGKRY